MTTYRMYDRTNNGTVGQDCGVFTLDDLPQRIKDAVEAAPDAGEWVLPALANGDSGEELSDLQVVVTAE